MDKMYSEDKISNKLFVCNMGMHRSRTGAEIFGGEYAGVYSIRRPLTKDILAKADVIYVMEPHHSKFIGENFPNEYLTKRIVCLEIPDVYNYGDEKLVKILKEKVSGGDGN